MTRQTRRRFSPEYKEQAVARLLAPGATQASVAAELGVTPTQLKTWRLELEAAGSASAIERQQAEAGELVAAAPGQQTSEGGGGGAAQGLGFFRTVGGEDMNAKLAFIAAHMAEHAVRLMCRVLGVSRSWFHAWRRAAPTRAERATRREVLVAEVREIFEASRQRYGAPRVHADLQAQGRRISKRTVAKLMKQNGIRPPRGKRRVPITTDSRHAHAVAPNMLDRNFEIAVPDTVWLADISYIPTVEGWLYLAAVKDLATMEIVGWSMSDRLKSTLCEDALKMAQALISLPGPLFSPGLEHRPPHDGVGRFGLPMLQAESAGLARSNGARGMAVASSRQRYHPPAADLVVQPIIR